MSRATQTQWSARIRCKEHALGGSFSVLIFLGAVPASPDKWISAPSYVGSFDCFTSSRPVPDDEADKNVQGFVDLSVGLADDLPEVTPERVVPYLRDNLRWRVRKVSGETVENGTVPSLKVDVLAQQLRYNPDNEHLEPVGEPREYPECTDGRSGA